MLPPVDEAVLTSNPKFALLYKTLTTKLLTPTGASKAEPQKEERDAIREALKNERIRSAKEQVLIDAITNVDPSASSSSLHPKLREPIPELLELLTLRLAAPNFGNEAARTLATDPLWKTLPSHITELSALISRHLQAQIRLLQRVASPQTQAQAQTTSQSRLPQRRLAGQGQGQGQGQASTAQVYKSQRQDPSKLAGTVETSLQCLAAAEDSLQASHLALLQTTTSLLAAYRSATQLSIEALERLKHSLYARAQANHADLLATKAQTTSLTITKKMLSLEKEVYTDDAIAALERYLLHLRDAGARVLERGRQAKRELSAYGVMDVPEDDDQDDENPAWQRAKRKEVVMKEIARVYGEVLAELAEVRADVERLG